MRDDLELLRQLRGLHDARIAEVVWRKADRSLRLTIEDMFSAQGTDDRGPAPGTVTFVAVENATVETGVFKGVFVVSRIDVDPRDGGFDVRIELREPGAGLRLRCRDLEVTIAGRKR